MEPTRRRPETEAPGARGARAQESGLLPEELEMLLGGEPLAGPLPLQEGGRMLEPLAVPAPPEPAPLRREAAEEEACPPQERGESFWSFGGETPAARRLDGWKGR